MNQSTTHNQLWSPNFIRLVITNLLMAIAFYFMTPVMPLFIADVFDGSTQQVGLIMFAFTITAILMRPFAGYVLDMSSRHRVYLLAFAMFLVLFLGYAFIPIFSLVVAVRFVHGTTWGVMNTAANTIVADITPTNRRGEAFGFFGLSMTIAMAFGPMLGMWIVGKSSYMVLFLCAVAFCVVGWLNVSLLKLPPIKPNRQPLVFSNLFEKSALSVSILALLTELPYGGMLSFIALYGREIGIENTGLFFLLLAIGVGISRVLSGRLFDRIGPQIVAPCGMLLLIVGLLAVSFWQTSIGFHLSGTLMGFGFGVLSPTMQAMANRGVAPQRRGAANSTYLMCFDSGIGLGMLFFGALIGTLGYSATFATSAAIVAIALVLFVAYIMPAYKRRLSAQGKTVLE